MIEQEWQKLRANFLSTVKDEETIELARAVFYNAYLTCLNRFVKDELNSFTVSEAINEIRPVLYAHKISGEKND